MPPLPCIYNYIQSALTPSFDWQKSPKLQQTSSDNLHNMIIEKLKRYSLIKYNSVHQNTLCMIIALIYST